MTASTILWNLSLGIFGGLFSGIIVSKVFFIQSNLKKQVEHIEALINRVGYIEGILYGIRVILEFSHDSDIEIDREKKEKGYKTDDEYYAAHSDKRWISAEKLLAQLITEMKHHATCIKDDLLKFSITDKYLIEIITIIKELINDIIKQKDFSFSKIRDSENIIKKLREKYSFYLKKSSKVLWKLLLRDKLILLLLVVFVLLMCGTIIATILQV